MILLKKCNTGFFLVILTIGICVLAGCKKKEGATPKMQTDSVYDIDSNVYKTVKIGNQWWMSENLHVSRYRNGKALVAITSNNNSLWDSTFIKGAYCLYENGGAGSTLGDSTGAKNKNITMGYLYNWYAVSDSNNIAPKGWHVATDADWQQLESFIGLSTTECNAIGWRGTSEANKLRYKYYGWQNSENQFLVYGTNETGFSALGGECRMFKSSINNGHALWGDFTSPGYDGYWWTATQHPDSTKFAWYRNLNYNNPKVFRFYAHKSYGFSIRCVKD
jgi:uncharacterized protein (TIGR02145 family)